MGSTRQDFFAKFPGAGLFTNFGGGVTGKIGAGTLNFHAGTESE